MLERIFGSSSQTKEFSLFNSFGNISSCFSLNFSEFLITGSRCSCIAIETPRSANFSISAILSGFIAARFIFVIFGLNAYFSITPILSKDICEKILSSSYGCRFLFFNNFSSISGSFSINSSCFCTNSLNSCSDSLLYSCLLIKSLLNL